MDIIPEDDPKWIKVHTSSNYTGRVDIEKKQPNDIQSAQRSSLSTNASIAPYDENNVFASYIYSIESYIVRNTRLYSFCLLCVTLWPRTIIILDMYTDFRVANDLYQSASNEKRNALFFMLTCLFISFSFLMVWMASLRFVQKYQQQQQSKYTKFAFNIFLVIYLIPPIGCIFVCIFELCWIVYDFTRGIYYFASGNIMIINTDPEIRTIVRYRKVVEFLCESFPQLILQLYIFFNGSSYVDTSALMISICVSAGSLTYNLGTLYFESKIHGMTTAEYALSLLQLSEIPIVKLVPRLPAIQNGLTDLCNFAYFRVDKESLGPIIDALSDNKCKLKKLKLSIHSLSDLTEKALKMLGNFLHSKHIQVIISQVAQPQLLLTLFQRLDIEKKGYLMFDEFKQLLLFTFRDEKIQETIFQHLALRRLHEKDRVYFYDFYESIAGYRSQLIEYDFSIIRYPIHFIFKYITKIFQACNTEKDAAIDVLIAFDIERYEIDASAITISNWKHIFHDLLNLYWFSIGLSYDTQLDEVGDHIFFTIADSLNSVQNITIESNYSTGQRIHCFIWKLTLDLLSDTDAIKMIHQLNHNQQHILSYCVEKKQWKLFAHLLNYVDDHSVLEGNKLHIDLPQIFNHAVTHNLEETVKYFIAHYSLQELLFDTQTLEPIALTLYTLFDNNIFQARKPSISMIKIFLSLLVSNHNQLLHKVMVGKYNLIRLAMKWRYTTHNVKESDSTLSSIKDWCKMNALENDDVEWMTMLHDELLKYQNWLLDVIEFFTKQNNLLWIDVDKNSISTMSFALNMKDEHALIVMVKNMDATHAHKILNHQHEMYNNRNIFSLCLEHKWYDVMCVMLERYLEVIDFNDTMDHTVFVIIQLYESYVTDYENDNNSFVNIYGAALCLIMEQIATKSAVHHITESMDNDTLKNTYNIIVHLAGLKWDKPHILSQGKYEILLNEFGDMRISRDYTSNQGHRRMRSDSRRISLIAHMDL